MTSRSSFPTRSRRGVPTLALLLAALVVVSALVFQAFRAEQDQRATASRALREYAGFAAWEFERESESGRETVDEEPKGVGSVAPVVTTQGADGA